MDEKRQDTRRAFRDGSGLRRTWRLLAGGPQDLEDTFTTSEGQAPSCRRPLVVILYRNMDKDLAGKIGKMSHYRAMLVRRAA